MIWDPSDANPLHRRLPAEITSRRQYAVDKKGPTLKKDVVDDIVVDQKTAISLKPDTRPKWLSKACKMTQAGQASSTELYSIIVHRRFSGGLPERIGKKLGVIVHKNLELFSDKQRRHLTSSEFVLNTLAVEAQEEEECAEDEAQEQRRKGIRLSIAEDKAAEKSEAAREQAKVDAKLKEAAGREKLKETEGEKLKREKEVEERETQEADRMTRLVEETAKRNRREAVQKQERRNFLVDEADQLSRKAAAEKADQKRKLEEEADALFERALCPAPARESERRDRGRGRSRSVSAKRVSESPPRRKAQWRHGHPGELTGSRAILLNRNFQEDLPHLARPSRGGGGGERGGGRVAVPGLAIADASRSRSRSRTRERSRRRRRR